MFYKKINTFETFCKLNAILIDFKNFLQVFEKNLNSKSIKRIIIKF